MQASCEVSLYPLTENYDQVVTDFCLSLKSIEGLEVQVNGISTQVFGPYELVWESIGKACKEVFESGKAVAVMKLAGSDLRPENLPYNLKSN
jgi:uncharacterized protein YqgV (UPF0045/DUF77 family)